MYIAAENAFLAKVKDVWLGLKLTLINAFFDFICKKDLEVFVDSPPLASLTLLHFGIALYTC